LQIILETNLGDHLISVLSFLRECFSEHIWKVHI
jgi:hypothetical protein